ncbi:MAG: 23S rRNA (uracil(1939)-C(5))-methyltransferase RlmD, partial [Coriobacteriales bacterium]|nr:23S rRNA (uracil(1939)-C(5))-methyltransferase RlmD [Coriobacteriales bacterium]
MRPNIQKNQSIECEISGYSSSGEGVAKIRFVDGSLEAFSQNHQTQYTANSNDGISQVRIFPVFVKGALVGEKVRIKIIKVARKCAWGRVEEILEASLARIELDCPYYKKCGSCTLRHMTYEEECKFKEQKVNDALQRLGHLDSKVEQFFPASNCDAYRNKTAFAVARAKNANIDLGLYYERSHDICNIHNCALQSKFADNALNIIRKWANKHSVRPYDEKTGRGLLRHIVLRTNASGDILVCLVCTRDTIEAQAELIDTLEKKISGFAGLILNVNKERGNVILGSKNICLYGNSYIYEELFGLRFRLDIASFFQVHLEKTKVLDSQILELGQFSSNDKVLDLYCGVGS